MDTIGQAAFIVVLLIAWAVSVHHARRRRDLVRGNAWRTPHRSGWPWRSERERNFWLWVLFG